MGIKDDKLENLYSVYGKENVDKEILMIRGKNKEILLMFFGIGDQEGKSVDEIADKFNITRVTVYRIINKELDMVEECLENPSVDRNKFLIGKSGTMEKLYAKYSEQEILKTIKLLDTEEQDVFCSYFGVNGYKVLSSAEISLKYGMNKEHVPGRARGILQKISSIIDSKNQNIRAAQKNTRLGELYKKYNEDEIRLAVETLYPVHKTIMELYLGSKDQKPKSVKEIGEIVNMSSRTVQTTVWSSIIKIENVLEDPNNRSILQEERKMINLEKMFAEHGKEKVLNNLNELAELERNVYIAYYGLNGKRSKTYREIAQEFNVSEAEALKMIRKAIYEMNKLLNDVEIKSDKLLPKTRSVLARYQYNEIVAMTQELKGKECYIVQLYLGIGGHKAKFKELMDMYDMSSDQLYSVINSFLSNALKIDRNLFLLYEIYGRKYSKKSIEEGLDRISNSDKNKILQNLERAGLRKTGVFTEEIEKLEKVIKESQEEQVWGEEVRQKRKELLRELLVVKDQNRFKNALEQLDSDEVNIIMSYFPVSKKKTLDISDLAKEYNMTNSEMRAKIKEVIDKINSLMKSNKR